MIEAGIIGSSGYTAGELFRILLNHPKVNIRFAYSTTKSGQKISDIHQDLTGCTDLKFTNQLFPEVNVVFLCLGHGKSSKFLKNNPFSSHTRIIDLSSDFRLKQHSLFEGKTFVYGLTEANKQLIKNSKYIANPGCFATAIELALLPLAASGNLKREVHVQAVTGSTGAGGSFSEAGHFSYRHSNFSYYKPFTHQHLPEIYQTLNSFQADFTEKIHFMPYRGGFSRGIYVSLYMETKRSIEKVRQLYEAYYKDTPFVVLSDKEIHLKQVINTNKCIIHLQKHNGTLLVSSCIDNLLKGASGQAVQNMNIQFGLDEQKGLKLKGSYF